MRSWSATSERRCTRSTGRPAVEAPNRWRAGTRRRLMANEGGPARALGHVIGGAIRAYQLLLSPILLPSCRYYPSCSHYAAEAVARHGAGRGSLLALRRLARCHPWGGSGYDPVPLDPHL